MYTMILIMYATFLEMGVLHELDHVTRYGSKRHSLQAVELSQWTQAAVQIVSNLPDLSFFGHAGHADPLDGWRCCSQKREMSRPQSRSDNFKQESLDL